MGGDLRRFVAGGADLSYPEAEHSVVMGAGCVGTGFRPGVEMRGGKRGAIVGFSDRAKFHCKSRIGNIDWGAIDRAQLLDVTLTYPGWWPRDGRVCKRHLDVWVKRLRWYGRNHGLGELEVLWVLEFQTKRRAPHFHMAIWMEKVRKLGQYRVVRRDGGEGWVVRYVDHVGKKRSKSLRRARPGFRSWIQMSWSEILANDRVKQRVLLEGISLRWGCAGLLDEVSAGLGSVDLAEEERKSHNAGCDVRRVRKAMNYSKYLVEHLTKKRQKELPRDFICPGQWYNVPNRGVFVETRQREVVSAREAAAVRRRIRKVLARTGGGDRRREVWVMDCDDEKLQEFIRWGSVDSVEGNNDDRKLGGGA